MPFHRFDPTAATLLSPRHAAVPDGALLVGPAGVCLKAPGMGGNARLRGDFDIATGIWTSDGAQPSDVAILTWELVIPRDPAPAIVLYRYGAKA